MLPDNISLSLTHRFGQHGRVNIAHIPVFILCGGLGLRIKKDDGVSTQANGAHWRVSGPLA